MNVVATVAKLSPVSQVILTVLGVVLTASVMWALRQVVKIVRGASAALDRLDEFTRAATAQMSASAEIAAIAAQLGTLTRRSDLQPLEQYLHEWRHDQVNGTAVQQGLIATQVKTLERTSDTLDRVSVILDRLATLEEQKTH